MNEMVMPTSEELAGKVYKYCKTNDISYIREDELVRKFVDDETQDRFKELRKNYKLNEKGYGEDEESSEAVILCTANLLMFSYKLSKRFYEILDILEKECKVSREIKEGEKFEYLTFFLADKDIKDMELVKSTIEIIAKKTYNYCKTNDIKYILKEDFGILTRVENDEKIACNINNKILKVLVENYMAKTIIVDEKQYIVFYLEDDDVEINKNMRLMAESISESIYDYCSENDIKYIEKEELMNNLNMDESGFNDAINILKERKFIDEEKNLEDGKTYINIY